MNFSQGAYVYHDVNRTIACSFAAALLLALPQLSHADQFTQIQNGPNTYWVPTAPTDPKDIAQNPSPARQPAPPQTGYVTGPGPYGYPPPPAYVVAHGPYYGPPPGYYYPPPPAAYYGPPPVAVGYYGGHYGSRVVVGIPGLFLGFHFH